MNHPDLPAGARVIVFSSAGDADAERLADVMRACDLVPYAAHLLSQGLSLLLRPAPGQPPIVLVAVVGNSSGLNGATIAKAVRALPGRQQLPLIMVGESLITPMSRCLSLPLPLDATRMQIMLGAPVDQWSTSGSPAPTTTGVESTSAIGDVPGFTTVKPINPENQHHHHVLVVDDNEVNRMVISRLVMLLGYNTSVVDSAAAALTHLETHPVDLLLTDCQMPDMDGYELARTLRRQEAGSGRHLPIIALTAHAQTEDRQRCLDAGMDDYLTKPASSDRLRTTLRHWLSTDVPTTSIPRRDSDSALPSVVFDPRPLQQIDASSPGMSTTILRIFSEDLERFIATTPALLRDGALDALGNTAHKLKGAAGSIGASQLFSACGELEREARNHAHEACATRLDETLTAAQTLLAHLAERPSG